MESSESLDEEPSSELEVIPISRKPRKSRKQPERQIKKISKRAKEVKESLGYRKAQHLNEKTGRKN